MNDTSQPKQYTLRGHLISGLIVAGALLSAATVLYTVTTYPRTDDAEVVANIIGMAPLVAGPVVELPVHDNDFVKKGSLLYKIDDRPYLYALQDALSAQERLEGEIQNESRRIAAQVSTVDVASASRQSAVANETRADDEIQVSEAAIAQANAALTQAQADADYAVGNLHRIEPLLAKEFVTPDDVHRARSLAEAKTAAVEQARSNLSLSKAKLLAATAQKQQAIAQLTQAEAQVKESSQAVLVLAPLLAQRESRAAAVRLARYNYEQCSVVAPFDARVTNLTISEGEYAKIGQQMFTLIDTRTWWVLANFRETQIAHLKVGTPADIYLMADLHSRLKGTVESVGFGVTPDPDVVGKLSQGLPDVQRTLNWVRLASRYPVRIRITDPPPGGLRVGEVAIVGMRSKS
ncbi:HlyD family efflux transporter periplasmic adaptor subunit [Edaphobacter sp. 12200R-103]|uniref:HlyD family efflux transporter periplasmic adaptor subunit n=1 Tax=Edaphobacter sp. 12200R-103 TaxID=2703788 RepID=UPI00138C9710|nr:HlyD family efflux transporter periplasmic adaptor subunit [Edaphobacter sp. 12200R-103]QHS53181.1 HlyD family efflux transporter periplasmic adaptor subunit [Edaphobacter sp. 12200R-103]